MSKSDIERIKKIKIENIIWIFYFIIILLSYYSNYYEIDYFKNKNIISKEKYRKINIFIFSVLVIIYSYFEIDSISSFFDCNTSSDKSKYDKLVFIATSLVLISGLIFLYIACVDVDLEEEIAFS